MPSMTPREVARHYRVGIDRVREWIRRGDLAAVNVGGLARDRVIVTLQALEAFEAARAAAPTKTSRRRKKATTKVDYYPD